MKITYITALKFRFSEKAEKIYLLSNTKSTRKIAPNCVAFSEYTNFINLIFS